MSCVYLEFESSKCELWDKSLEMPGCNSEGICICSDDEDPSVLCEDYDSLECEESGCEDCGFDECECEDDDCGDCNECSDKDCIEHPYYDENLEDEECDACDACDESECQGENCTYPMKGKHGEDK